MATEAKAMEVLLLVEVTAAQVTAMVGGTEARCRSWCDRSDAEVEEAKVEVMDRRGRAAGGGDGVRGGAVAVPSGDHRR